VRALTDLVPVAGVSCVTPDPSALTEKISSSSQRGKCRAEIVSSADE
jgi:hypothetical protein